MILSEPYILSCDPPLEEDFVDLQFRFRIVHMPQSLKEDIHFPYEDEIFLVNVGETGKFEASSIYQSKFTVLRAGEHIQMNGYAPDFCRKSNIIRDRAGNTLFSVGREYEVALHWSKYRCYVEIDGGAAATSYGNGREAITQIIFYARKGVTVELNEASVCLSQRRFNAPIADRGLARMIERGLFCNYLFWHNAPDGVYFDRLSLRQTVLCTTRNSPAYQTNVAFDAYTDARKIRMTFAVSDLPTEEWPLQFAFFINGTQQPAQPMSVRKDEVHSWEFCVPAECPACNRLTIVFPCSVAMAVQKVEYDSNARFAPVEKQGTAYFFGDSITEGSECFDPGAMYVQQVAQAYELYALDQAVSGRTFSDYTILGEYPRAASCVFLACGTNSFCGGVQDRDACFAELEVQMEQVILQAETRFPSAVILALLPIWRSDAQGVHFSLAETSEKMRAIYQRHPRITIIDCYDFVPHESAFFSNSELALHPNSAGHRIYGENLLRRLRSVLGEPPRRDHIKDAARALSARQGGLQDETDRS